MILCPLCAVVEALHQAELILEMAVVTVAPPVLVLAAAAVPVDILVTAEWVEIYAVLDPQMVVGAAVVALGIMVGLAVSAYWVKALMVCDQ